MSKGEKVIVVRETNFQAYVADAISLGTMCAAFWFNYRFIGGNDAFDALLFSCFFLFAFSRTKDIRRAIKEAEQS